MNVTLHIGTPKTASTAIQNLFTLNEEKFRDQGIYYPIPPHSRGEKTTDVKNDSFIFEKMRYFEDIIPKSEESFEKFFRDFCCSSKKEALKENIKQIFISSEMFWLFNETKYRR